MQGINAQTNETMKPGRLSGKEAENALSETVVDFSACLKRRTKSALSLQPVRERANVLTSEHMDN